MTIVGIDPGSAGGIAILREDGSVTAFTMPEDDVLVAGLQELNAESPRVFIERIPKFCGAQRFAERNIMGSSLAVLYGNYRFCCGILAGLGNPPQLLVPIKWQNIVECRNHERLDKLEWKRKLKSRAQELFPGVKVTLATADALLIAYAGRIIGHGRSM